MIFNSSDNLRTTPCAKIGTITLDKNQILIYQELQELSKICNKKRNIFSRLFSNKPKNIYIHGQVGRGKSMLMNEFFNSIKQEKKYFHFNDFMQNIHKELHNIRSNSTKKEDILSVVIDNILGDISALCLDEFQVHDVVDAMILSDVFRYIFQKNIITIFTSNAYPLDLYKNGLQREYFLKFLKNILFKECKILNLDGKKDYRSLNTKLDSYFLYPINKPNRELFDAILEKYLSGSNMKIWEKDISGRKLIIKNSSENIILIDFMETFSDNLGVVDFMEICKNFNIIFIKNMPELNNNFNNEAKRFILFIDEAYENNVKLIILSQNSIDKIYHNGLLFDLFQRAASRLNQLTNKR